MRRALRARYPRGEPLKQMQTESAPVSGTASRGPAPTKDRILDAAEALFMEHGFEATSLRQITTHAEVNLAAVSYHFGSKERLYRAALQLVSANRGSILPSRARALPTRS